MVFDMGFGALYMPKAETGDYTASVMFNAGDEDLDDIVIKRSGHGMLERAMEEQAIVRVDSAAKMTKELEGFKEAHNLKNVLLVRYARAERILG